MGVLDIVIEKPAEVSRSGECVWYSHGDYVKHTPLQLTSADFSMTMSSTHLFHWLQQGFPWLCQAHISSTDLSRFFHHYIKHTHRLWKNLLKSVKTMGMFNIIMEQLAEVSRGDGCVWYSHEKTCWSQSKRWVLTSADFSMTMSSTHLFHWLQQGFPWLCQAHISSTDFSRFFHHYI
jgi:G:T-mismatch repair DNA endonuclease (very short patch repair protein)